MLEQALHSGKDEVATETAVPDEASQEQRRRLQHEKAEAISRYNEARRLAEQRDARQRSGASRPAGASHGQQGAAPMSREQQLLSEWDTGVLRIRRNRAAVAAGHGRLESATGVYLDIGGSTGGGARRVVDGRVPPDWRKFSVDDEGARQ